MVKFFTLCFLFLSVIDGNLLFAQDSLKVVTFNLAGRKPGTDPDKRLFYTIQNLKGLNPDIIGLQEINESVSLSGSDNQGKLIADSLSAFFGLPYYSYSVTSHLSWNDQFREMIGIISKYPVLQKSNVTLATGAYPRKAVWNLIETPLGTVNFFNTHLDYLNPSVRITEINQVLSFIELKEGQFPSIGLILTGDFNDVPGSTPLLQITNSTRPFTDTFRSANPSANGYTLPAQGPTSRIDFIFSRDLDGLKILSSEVIMNKPYYLTNYCSDHRGVMTTFVKISTGSSVDRETDREKPFDLFPSYPNPFNPETTISYRLAVQKNTRLFIYNSIGQVIRMWNFENQNSGNHSVRWDGKDQFNREVPTGIYFIQVESGGFTKTGKLVLVK